MMEFNWLLDPAQCMEISAIFLEVFFLILLRRGLFSVLSPVRCQAVKFEMTVHGGSFSFTLSICKIFRRGLLLGVGKQD